MLQEDHPYDVDVRMTDERIQTECLDGRMTRSRDYMKLEGERCSSMIETDYRSSNAPHRALGSGSGLKMNCGREVTSRPPRSDGIPVLTVRRPL